MTGQLALWEPEPCDTAPAPAPRPRTRAADGRRQLRARRIEPEAGRAAGSHRRWIPVGRLRIHTINPPEEYL